MGSLARGRRSHCAGLYGHTLSLSRILFLPGGGVGGKGGAAKGPEWAWMVGWEIGFREQGAGWGAVRRLGGNLRPRENVGAKKGSQRCQES